MRKSIFKLLFICIFFAFLFSGCAYNFFGVERNMFEGFHGIFTVMEPYDINVYKEMLPKQFSMPPKPLVGVFFVDYYDTEPWHSQPPLNPYLEASVLIRCVYNGKEGWFPLTMPVSTKAACLGGWKLGFPKYVANEMILSPVNDGWIGKAIFKEEDKDEEITTIQLEFTQAQIDTTDLPDWQADFLTGEQISGLNETVINLIPLPSPLKGSIPFPINMTPPTFRSRQTGYVKIETCPPWAGLPPLTGLIPPGSVSPALFQKFDLHNN